MGMLKAARPVAAAPEPEEQPTVPVPVPSAVVLWTVVEVLRSHEEDLADLLIALCRPRHVARSRDELPAHPEGPLKTYSVQMPDDGGAMTTLARLAFAGCEGLEQVTLPDSVTAIEAGGRGGGAFYGCTALTGVTLPPGIATIGQQASAPQILFPVPVPVQNVLHLAPTFCLCCLFVACLLGRTRRQKLSQGSSGYIPRDFYPLLPCDSVMLLATRQNGRCSPLPSSPWAWTVTWAWTWACGLVVAGL